MKRLDLITLFILSLVWGASFLFIKVAVETIPPFTLVFGRIALAAVILYLVLRIRGMRLPPFGPVWGLFLLMGFLNGALPYTLISAGQVYIDSGLAAILTASVPVFTIVLSHFLVEDESLSWQRFLGVLVGLAGVVILVGTEALGGVGSSFWAQMAIVGGSVSYALALVVGRRYLKGYPVLVSATGQMLGGVIFIAPLSLLLDAPWRLSPSWISLGALISLSVLGTSLGYLLFFHLLKRVGSTNTSLVTYLMPPTGVMLGVLLLGERLHWRALLALVLILAGIAGTSGRWSAWLSARRSGKRPQPKLS